MKHSTFKGWLSLQEMATADDRPSLIRQLASLYRNSANEVDTILNKILSNLPSTVKWSGLKDGKYGVPVEINGRSKAAVEFIVKGKEVTVFKISPLKLKKEFSLNRPVLVFT